MQPIIDWWNSLPYVYTGAIVRAVRVFVYGAIPVVAAWILSGNNDDLITGLRMDASAAVLALIDKGVREARIASKANEDATDPVEGDEEEDLPDEG